MGADAVAAPRTSTDTTLRPHYPCLDGLRAVAVLILFFQHTGYSTGLQFRDGFRWMGHMEIGPTTFFVLSAFLLYQPFVAAHLTDREPLRWTSFLRGRALRVIPMYWVSLTLLILFFRASSSSGFEAGLKVDGWADGLSLYTFTQIYNPQWFFHGIPAAYTLNVEVAFYFLLPVWAWCMRRLGRDRSLRERVRLEIAALAGLAAVSVAWRVAIELVFEQERRACLADASPHVSCAAVQWLPGYLDYFALGMAVAVVATWRTLRGQEPGWLQWIGRRPDLLFGIALALFVVYSAQLGTEPGLTYVGIEKAEARHLLNGVIVVCALLPGVFGPQDRGVWRAFLRWRPIVFAGLVSYGIYLWHQGWTDKVIRWTGLADGWPAVASARRDFLVVTALAAVLSIATAAVGYVAIERPVVRRRNRPLRQWLSATAAKVP